MGNCCAANKDEVKLNEQHLFEKNNIYNTPYDEKILARGGVNNANENKVIHTNEENIISPRGKVDAISIKSVGNKDRGSSVKQDYLKVSSY